MQTKELLLSAALLGLVGIQPAWGQAAVERPASQALERPTSEDNDIIVTARKRQESILRVPVIENVVSEKTLTNYQITDLMRLQTRVPGLQLGSQVLASGAQVTLHGIGTTSLDSGVDQSVILNIDGLSMTQGLAYESGFFDLAGVEVLKGPQALFFGKNSPGGVISLRTNDPGDTLEVIGRLGYEGEAHEMRTELIVSGPVTSTLGIRLAGAIDDMDGYFRNRATAQPGTGALAPRRKRIDDKESYILRGTAVFKPSYAFDARLKANFTRDNVKGNAGMAQLSNCPDGTGVPAGRAPVSPLSTANFINPADNCKLDRNYYIVDMDPAAFPGIPNGGTPYSDILQRYGSLEMNYRPADLVTLTSVTGYYWMNFTGLDNGVQSGYSAPSLYAYSGLARRDFTQELRGDTNFASPLNFTAGAYYQRSRVRADTLVGGNIRLFLPAVLINSEKELNIESYSAFGQVRWKPVSNLEIAGGVRWVDEKRTSTASPGTEIKSSKFSPELNITYTPTDDFTVFGSLKQGYKSGSYPLSSPSNTAPPFGDERIRAAEGGIKTRLFDRSLSVNLAGYYYKYVGLQVQANTPDLNGIPQVLTLNAGGAKIYGIDLDASWRVRSIEGLTVNGALNWTHARFTDLQGVPCWGGQTIAEGCNELFNANTGAYTSQNLSGTRLVRAPDWQVQGGFDYELPLGDRHKLSFGADAQYSSQFPTTLGLNRPDIIQQAYAIVNANINIGSSNDRWQLSLIGNNLTDKITAGRCDFVNEANGSVFGGYATGTASRGPAGVDETLCTPRRGRELWVRITLRPTAGR